MSLTDFLKTVSFCLHVSGSGQLLYSQEPIITDHLQEVAFIAFSCVLNHETHVCTQQPARQGGSASPSPAHDVVMRAQYLHSLDLREVSGRNLVFSLQLDVDFWQSADKLSLLVFLSKYTRHLLLQVADDVGMYLKG